MRLVVLLAEGDPDAWDRASTQERQRVLDAHDAFHRAVLARGDVLGGEALGGTDTARTLRTVGGERVDTAGPYAAETVEQLGGFYVVDLPSVADAVEVARLLPDHYTVEVRPIVGLEGYEAPS